MDICNPGSSLLPAGTFLPLQGGSLDHLSGRALQYCLRHSQLSVLVGLFRLHGGYLIPIVVKRIRHDNPGYLKTAKETVDVATEKIASHKPNLAFLYLQHVDHIGHTSFWGSRDYIDALSQTDQWLQDLIQKIDADGSYHIMVITDHGGAGNHHANGDLNENVRNIPFVAYGPAFQKDHLISPSRTTQIAPTVAHLFGQPPLESWPDHGLTDIFKPVR